LPNGIASFAERRGVRQFVKFGIVGFSGLIVNLIVFTILQRLDPDHQQALHYDALYSIGFLAGGLSNYWLNRVWTFRSSGDALREGAQFLTVSVLALITGLIVSALVAPALGHGHRTWFIATVAGIFVNFFINKYWTFKGAGS
jgi:putative flippase GtrA